MDTKALRLQVKDASRGEVEAVFSTYNVVDAHGDVTLPGAFTDGERVVISAYGHASWDGRLPVGTGVIRTTGTEAVLKGQFLMNTAHGADTFHTVEALGDLGQWSYGFDVTKESYGDHNGHKVRFLEGLKVHEVSPVLLGAGVNTRTLATKSAGENPRDELTPEQRRFLEQMRAKTVMWESERLLKRYHDLELGRAAFMKAAKHITVWYVEVDAAGVPASKRAVAEAALTDYCIDLRCGPKPALKWFRPETRAESDHFELYGRAAAPGFGWLGDIVAKADRGRNEVWIRTDQTPVQVHVNVAHEIVHLAGGDEDAARAIERDAEIAYYARGL